MFGLYFGTVVFTELVKHRQVPNSVQMLANRRGDHLEAELRVNGSPVYTYGVEGV